MVWGDELTMTEASLDGGRVLGSIHAGGLEALVSHAIKDGTELCTASSESTARLRPMPSQSLVQGALPCVPACAVILGHGGKDCSVPYHLVLCGRSTC